MRKVLEELYLGNILPNEKAFVKDSAFGKALAVIETNETYLNTALDGTEKEAFSAFVDAQTELNALTGQEGFIDGFRLGMQITLAALYGDGGELRPIK